MVRSVLRVPQHHPARSLVDIAQRDWRVAVLLVAMDLDPAAAGQQVEAVVVRRHLRWRDAGSTPPRAEQFRGGIGEGSPRGAEIVIRSRPAILLKEEFQLFWECDSPAWAAKFLDAWCTRAMRSRTVPVKKFTGTVRAHRELLLNYFRAKKQFSSGIIEGLNNKAKSL